MHFNLETPAKSRSRTGNRSAPRTCFPHIFLKLAASEPIWKSMLQNLIYSDVLESPGVWLYLVASTLNCSQISAAFWRKALLFILDPCLLPSLTKPHLASPEIDGKNDMRSNRAWMCLSHSF